MLNVYICRPIRPIQGKYTPVPDMSVLKPVEDFLKVVKECQPDACMLYAWEVQPKTPPFLAPPLSCSTPIQRLSAFLKTHVCLDGECDCAQHYLDTCGYNDVEVEQVELETRGQRLNKNWFTMRKGLVTASNTKTVLSSTDMDRTAEVMLQGSSLCEDNLPPAVRFGRDNEEKALRDFCRSHRYRHRKCKLWQPGLVISTTTPFLGASPDAFVECEETECGRFLVEVKCLFSFRNFHPKQALKEGGFCEKDCNGQYIVKRTHGYYHQMQCQMGLTGCHKSFLCVYTTKGIETIEVSFDDEYWQTALIKLKQFWKKNLFPKLVTKLQSGAYSV